MLAVPAGAQSEDAFLYLGSEAPPASKACRKDLKRFCKGVKPGKKRLARCLLDHYPKLTWRCRHFAGGGGRGRELETLSGIDAAELRR